MVRTFILMGWVFVGLSSLCNPMAQKKLGVANFLTKRFDASWPSTLGLTRWATVDKSLECG